MAGGSREPGRSVASRVLAVLDAFDATHTALGVSDLARRSGLALSTTHRLVAELEQWGALARRADGQYEVGRRLWQLGVLAPVHRELRDVALPYLQDVLAVTGENVHLAVRDDLAALYVERIHSQRAVPVVSATGARLPLHATGVGKVLLAEAPAVVLSRVLQDLTAVTPHTVTDPARLRAQLAEVRRRGYARTLDEMTVGTASLAVPVRDDAGRTQAALGVVLDSSRRGLTRHLPALRVAALGISRSLVASYVR
jgi:DNA-binding IclR family transcriptional regulator